MTELGNTNRKHSNISEEFKKIAENITVVIWKAKLNKKQEFEETYISPVIDEILELPKGTINNDWNKFFEYVKPKYLPKIQEAFQKAFLSPNMTVSFDYQVIKKNKETADFRSTGRCLIENESLFVFGTTTDITKEKKAETELKISDEKIKKQNVELRQLNAEKDKLFSIISHDLRSPFSALIGFSDLLKQKIDIYDKKRIQKLISLISETAKATFELLDDLLKWANFQQNKIDYNPKNIDLYDFTRTKIKTIKNLASQKEIEIVNKISKQTKIFADENMLSTIFRNLLTNALKFTNKGGKINIFTVEKATKIEISIKDNGIGIPIEIQSKLFQINSNISTQGTESETGTGFGLMLCKDFTEKNGGEIFVKSEIGKGSVFTFSMPKLDK